MWHKSRGFKRIGYHYLIDLNGEVLKGRDIETIGAHCKNHNAHSIGIAYVGGLSTDGTPKDTRTDEQKDALFCLLSSLHKQYPKAKIYGHNDFANKACPCFDVKAEYKVFNH